MLSQPNEAQDILMYDVDAANFEVRVMQESFKRPVLVDFWAPWCGPCKQLMPVLESAIQVEKGAVVLAKVNLDENPQLAQALRVKSVPTVFAFFQGQPIDAFQGVVPAAQIKAFIDKAVQIAKQAAPDAIDIPEALKAAAQALAENDLGTAQGIYAQILSQDENNAPAYVGLVRLFIAAGQIEQAAQIAEQAPEEVTKNAAFAEAKTALELAQNVPSGDLTALHAKLDKTPGDHAARIELALALFALGEKAEAIDHLLESIRIDREWSEEEARKQLLKIFSALGFSDPLAVEGRKKLSSILFS